MQSKEKRNVLIILLLFLMILFQTMAMAVEKSPWNCPECGRKGNTGKFCGGCGHPAPEIAEQEETDFTNGTNKADRTIVVGDIITFGRYEQDNNSENGPEAIEWIVLDYDKTGKRALLLSRYGLDAKPYNTETISITWEECTIRKWLNKDFFNAAFNQKEQAAILMTAVDNSVSQGYSEFTTIGGNKTKDRLFLLSYKESNRYLDVAFKDDGNNMKSRVAPTAYAIANGAFTREYYTEDGDVAGEWWLRSPGNRQYTAARVSSSGSLTSSDVRRGDGVVRPAIWINLKSDIF